MKNLSIFSTLALVGLLASASSAQKPATKPAAKPPVKPTVVAPKKVVLPSTIVARVNNRDITTQELVDLINRTGARDTVQKLIQYAIIEEEARKAGATIEPKDIAEKVKTEKQRIVANMASQTGSPQTFTEITSRYGLTEAEVEWGVRLQILSQKAYAKQVEKQVPTLEAQVKVEHILLLTMNQPGPDGKPLSPADQKKKEDEQRTRLEGIVADVKAGKMTFEDAAKKYSDDKASGAEGGALPWFGRTGMMVPEFETAAFNLAKEGEISPLVKTQYGFHVLKLVKRGKEASAAEKAKFKAEEIKKLTTTGTGMQQWLQGLVQKATITLNPPAVNVKK